jgi:hypothetical protein
MRYRGNPLGYINEFFGIPWAKQIEVVEAFMRPPHRVLVRAGHNVGKSWLQASLLGYAYECEGPCRCIAASTTLKTLNDAIFMELRKHRPKLPGMMPAAPEAKRKAGWDIMGRAAGKGVKFQGRHGEKVYLFLDEGTGIPEQVFTVANTMFTGETGAGGILVTYNPDDQTAYVKTLEMSDQWTTVVISQFDHPNVIAELAGLPPPYPSAVRLAQVISMMDAHSRKLGPEDSEHPDEVSLQPVGKPPLRWIPGPEADCRVLGRWAKVGANVVWSESAWAKMCKVRHTLNPDWLVQIGCDVARYGDDETVIMVRKGPCWMVLEHYQGQSTKRTGERLRELCWEFQTPHQPAKTIPVLIDGVGMGGPLVDHSEGFNFVDVISSARSTRPKEFYNMRAELHFVALEQAEANMIDLSRIAHDDLARLKRELMQVTYTVRPDNVKLVDKKDVIKARIGKSPDYGDCFNLAAYWVN